MKRRKVRPPRTWQERVAHTNFKKNTKALIILALQNPNFTFPEELSMVSLFVESLLGCSKHPTCCGSGFPCKEKGPSNTATLPTSQFPLTSIIQEL
jgi:hypothetical protein